MAKLTVSDFTTTGNDTSFITALNQAFTDVEAAVENTVSLDGTAPNEMAADLNMGGFNIVNVGNIAVTGGGNGELTGYTSAQIALLGATLTAHTLVYNTDTNKLNFYDVTFGTWYVVDMTPA